MIRLRGWSCVVSGSSRAAMLVRACLNLEGRGSSCARILDPALQDAFGRHSARLGAQIFTLENSAHLAHSGPRLPLYRVQGAVGQRS